MYKQVPLFHFISTTEESRYLADLVQHMPLSTSQFGLVLTSVLEAADENGSKGISNPTENIDDEPEGFRHPHFRSVPLPLPSLPPGSSNSTVVDITIQGHSECFFAHCEKEMMQAAIDAAESGASTDNATGDNLLQALKKQPADSVIVDHYDNICSIISTILERKARNFIREVNKDGKVEPEYFYSINDIWLPALAAYGELTDGNRAVKFVINEHDLLLQEDEVKLKCLHLENDQGLTLGPMEGGDIDLMIELNGVKYDSHYGRHIIKRSVCFRSKDGKMVAWAGTHGDFSIAALHVLPAYRKLGLGRLVLWHLAREHMRLARKALEIGGTSSENIPATALYAHADCLDHNLPTMVFMERCGWHRIGMYNWIGLHADPKA
ncbi:hypothetical protein BGZ93_002371 [Podila epicladia]|nr:hypothetical protein BGZ92_004543 [Podila epicladia]KAG0082571.1 hypothetical protein BGZ93_002371 [Podila epicladia]